MHRLKMSLITCIIVTVVATLPLTAGNAKASPLNCGTWSVVSSVNFWGYNNYVEGVAASSATNVWAVGYYNNSRYPSQMLLAQWIGGNWILWGAPSPGSQGNLLYGVAAPSANNTWAVGYYDNSSGVAQTLIEHWDGGGWNPVSSPNVGSNNNALYSVAALSASNIWAVGEYYNSSSIVQTLIEHWNGSSWSIVQSPNFGSSNNALYSVTAVSASDVWAVGWYYNGSAGQTLIEHWDGTNWNLVSSPNRGSHGNFLYSVTALSASNIWAVGAYWNGSANQTLIEHWNGGGWNLVSSPNAGSDSLHGVTALSASNIWAVGNYFNGSVTQTLTEHWDGSIWSLVSSPNVGSGPNALSAVASVPGSSSMWAVGYSLSGGDAQTLTEYYC